MAVPHRVHIRTPGHEELHHRDAIPVEGGSHEGPVAALVHVRPVIEHPGRHGEPLRARCLPGHAAFGNPRERPVFAIAQRSPVQRRVAGHQGLDPIEVVGVDRLLELPDLLQRVNVGLEPRPAREAVEARDLELRVGDRRRGACLEQVLGLVLQVAEIRAVREEDVILLRGSIGMATSFQRNARCPHIGLKEGGDDWTTTGGLLPFPRTGCVLDANAILSQTARSTDKAHRNPGGLPGLRPACLVRCRAKAFLSRR